MNRFHLALAATLALAGTSRAAAEDLDTGKLVPVTENHATLVVDKVAYTLDSYIVLFEQPYYVKLRRDDGKPVDADLAARIAQDYIQPRGCTAPLSRRKDLDRSNSNHSQWLIGIQC